MNPEVIKMQAFNPGGNIIPHAWYKNIRKETGKPDLLALCILADICYWYRPTVVKDEKTGEVTGLKQKFKRDLLQKSYKSYAELFGMSKRKVKSSFDLLESLGFIKREFRNIETDLGKLTNVMFISINPERIQEASTIPATVATPSAENQSSYHLPTKNDPTLLKKTTPPSPLKTTPGRGEKKGDLLYTKNTTENTTEIETETTSYKEYCASNDAQHTSSSVFPPKDIEISPQTGPEYITYKGKKLSGKKLEMFLTFWETFGDKRNKAKTADAWLEIKNLEAVYPEIIEGAKKYANIRPALLLKKLTPKMAEGWLRAKRWEDEIDEIAESLSLRSRREVQNAMAVKEFLEDGR